jgi:D-3-phosphoglycerate dehydrogenase
MMKILVATEKPFATAASDGIIKVFDRAGYQTILLENYKNKAQLCDAIVDADALIVRSDKVDKDVIDAARKLKIVVRAGAGYDNIDVAECSSRSIAVMNTPGQNSNAVAELAIGMMIYMLRNNFTCGTGSEMRGKTLGIHGYGNVGHRVAVLGKSFGMKLVGCDSKSHLDGMFGDGALPAKDAQDLYSRCNIVSVHIPANDATKKMVNAALVGAMPPCGILINTARKEIIDEDELFALMQKRQDLCYATDIMPANHEQMMAAFGKRYFATEKKMGAETDEANMNAGLSAARQIVGFFEHDDRTFQLNK